MIEALLFFLGFLFGVFTVALGVAARRGDGE